MNHSFRGQGVCKRHVYVAGASPVKQKTRFNGVSLLLFALAKRLFDPLVIHCGIKTVFSGDLKQESIQPFAGVFLHGWQNVGIRVEGLSDT